MPKFGKVSVVVELRRQHGAARHEPRGRAHAQCAASASAPGCYWCSSWDCSRGTSARSTAGWSSIRIRVETTRSQPARQGQRPRMHTHCRSSMGGRPSHGRLRRRCPSGRPTTSRARARCCASSLTRSRGTLMARVSLLVRGARCRASMRSAAAQATARAMGSASRSAARPARGPPAARARPGGTAPRARCVTRRLISPLHLPDFSPISPLHLARCVTRRRATRRMAAAC